MAPQPRFRPRRWIVFLTCVSAWLLGLMLAGAIVDGGVAYAADAAPAGPAADKLVYMPLARSGAGDSAPQPGGLSSDALIETARRDGKLDEETALLYRVYAGFGDVRLPAAYRGDDGRAGPGALHSVGALG